MEEDSLEQEKFHDDIDGHPEVAHKDHEPTDTNSELPGSHDLIPNCTQKEQGHQNEGSSVPQKRPASSEGEEEEQGHKSKTQREDHMDDNNTVSDVDPKETDPTAREKLINSIRAFDGNISLNKLEGADLTRAALCLGLSNSRVEGNKWVVEGLLKPLYPHQLLGLYFMLKRELSTVKPYGGINADSMGLGKTATALATVVMNPPDENDLRKGRRTTLWVGPKSSCAQVFEEMSKFCCREKLPKILQYNGPQLEKLHGEALGSFLQQQDIIIASYPDLVRDCHVRDRFKENNERYRVELTMGNFGQICERRFGPLMKSKFYRVILDEAQHIKDPGSQKFLASWCLDTKYSWCLTGTPCKNRRNDLLPYLSFLRVPENSPLWEFCNILPKRRRDQGRINRAMRIIMIRRNNCDTVLGQPLIDLPTVHREIISVALTTNEWAIYKFFALRTRSSFNLRHKAVKPKKNMWFIMREIIRLRELACDPRLIEYMIESKDEFRIVKEMLDVLRPRHRGVNPLYDMIQRWYIEKQDEMSRTCEKCKKMFDSLLELQKCGHSFCVRCINGCQVGSHEVEQGQLGLVCPSCKKEDHSIRYEAFAALAEDLPSPQPSSSRVVAQTNGPAYCRKPRLVFKAGRVPRYFKSIEETPGLPVMVGSKMQAIKEAIQKHLTEGPNDKVVIFAEYKYSAKMIGYMLDKMRLKHAYYFSSETQKIRIEGIEAFRSDPDLRIMVLSMRSGTEALDLSCANRAIMVEPWWNKSVEDQAFGRIWRHGQVKETYVTRIVTNKTIETKVVDLQHAKAIEIAVLLEDDFTGDDVKRSETLIANLLGRAACDDQGRVISLKDEDESEDEEITRYLNSSRDGSNEALDIEQEKNRPDVVRQGEQKSHEEI